MWHSPDETVGASLVDAQRGDDRENGNNRATTRVAPTLGGSARDGPATRGRAPKSRLEAPVEKTGGSHNNEAHGPLAPYPCSDPLGTTRSTRADPGAGAGGSLSGQPGMTLWSVENGSLRPA